MFLVKGKKSEDFPVFQIINRINETYFALLFHKYPLGQGWLHSNISCPAFMRIKKFLHGVLDKICDKQVIFVALFLRQKRDSQQRSTPYQYHT